MALTALLSAVSGLILAGAGAVSHDEVTHGLGIAFRRMNVRDLVGWAFNVAAGADLLALVCILFWKGRTKQGVIAVVTPGMIRSPAVPEEFPGDPDSFPGHPDGFGPDPSAPAASVPADRSADGGAVVATWNSGRLFTVADAQARTDGFAALAADVRPDVLLLDEITSLEVARTVAEAMGLPTGPENKSSSATSTRTTTSSTAAWRWRSIPGIR